MLTGMAHFVHGTFKWIIAEVEVAVSLSLLRITKAFSSSGELHRYCAQSVASFELQSGVGLHLPPPQ